MSYMMGIDVGTTGTRAVIVRPDGHVVSAATVDHQPMRMVKPGWAEQNAEDWWQAAIGAVRDALQLSALKGSDIVAVGFSGQMHGVALLDKANAVLRPAIIWCDQRTQAQCDWITSRIGADRLIRLVSNPALTGFSAPKLLWIRDHEPEIYERAAHFLLPKDYVRFRLTGEFATDVSDASGTLLLDVTHRRWSKDVLSVLQIDHAILPSVHESVETTGAVTHEAALLTGLRAGTPVVAGAGDQAASAVGNGIVTPGLTSATLGTSGVIFAYTEMPKIDPQGRVHTFCHAVPQKWHVMGVTQGAGLSLRWFREQIGETESWYARQVGVDPYDAIIEEARRVPAGSDGLLFLPYLMGERTPHLDPLARGMWFGLTASHTRGHLIRSILEGVAFSLRDSLEILKELQIPVHQVRASGGGSRNPLWRQIQSEIYAKEVVTLRESEGSAYGAALLAGVGGKVYTSVAEAAKETIQIAAKIEPDVERVQSYEKLYPIYRRLYPAVRDLSHKLAGLHEEAGGATS
ncbi:MAG TPA: xylulokinase [Terriglobia bacterium]|nr:xylulokinase [Terriglobia bacterium]